MTARENLVGGRWVGGSGERLVSRDPATGAVVWEGASAGPGEVAAAAGAAADAFPRWRRLPLRLRERRLRAFAHLLEEGRTPLAEAISREVGKPPWEAGAEVDLMVAKVGVSIDAHAQRCGDIPGGRATTRFAPHGVVCVLGPFNYPGHLPNGHVVPALLAGNTILLKPSEHAPLVGQLVAEAWHAAGLPAGVLNVLQGGRATAEAILDRPELAAVLMTGSARTGRAIHRRFAGRPEVLLALEMGGNNPLIVHDVADLAAAAHLSLLSAYLTAGQRCSCARRLIVVDGPSADAFVSELVAQVERIRVGGPEARPEPFMGPVITPSAAEGVLAAHAELCEGGAVPLLTPRVLRPGTGLLSPGLLDVTPAAERPDEEVFGPLLQLVRVPDVDAAIAEANRTRFGLAAGLISDDGALWERFAAEVRAGVVNWNAPLPGASSRAAFGGLGASGNHRPGAWLAADYCSHAVATIAEARPTRAEPPPGLS